MHSICLDLHIHTLENSNQLKLSKKKTINSNTKLGQDHIKNDAAVYI
jgi:hypothetical protein